MLEIKKESIRKFDFIKYLKQEINLTDYQCEKLDEIFYDMPYEVKEIVENKIPSLWWRLSIFPFYLNYFILILLFPFNWIITGKTHYNIQYIRKWEKKILGED